MSVVSHILAPFDFSDASGEGVRYACDLAKASGAKVTILHVVQEPSFPSFFKLGALRIYGMVPDAEKLAWRALEKRFGMPENVSWLDFRVIKGDAETQIVRLAGSGEFDLVVLASHGLTGMEYVLLGSVAEKVVRNSPISTLVVKQVVQPTDDSARILQERAKG